MINNINRLVTVPGVVLTLSAVLSSEIEGTLAVEIIGEVNTGGSRWAGGLGAVNNVLVTVTAGVAWRTHTLVPCTTVHTRCTVLTQTSFTCIKLILAPNTNVVS